MFPGSKVVGNVHVGNNVVIAANSVVFLLEETMLSFDNQFALNYIKKKIFKCTMIFKSSLWLAALVAASGLCQPPITQSSS